MEFKPSLSGSYEKYLEEQFYGKLTHFGMGREVGHRDLVHFQHFFS